MTEIVSLYRRARRWNYRCASCGFRGGSYRDWILARRMADIHAGLPHPKPSEAP